MKKLTHILFSLTIFATVLGELRRFSVLGQDLLLTDIFLPLLFLVWVVDKIHSDRRIRLGKIGRMIVLFLFVLFLTYIINWLRFDTFQMIGGVVYLGRLGMYSLLALMGFDLLDRDESGQFKRLVLISMIGSAFLISILGFLQLKYFPSFLELGLHLEGWDPHVGRLLSTWFDPNYVGGFLGFMLPVVVALGLYFYRKRSFKWAFLLAGVGLFCLMAIYLTYSRSAYLTLIGGMGLLTLFKSRRLLVVFLMVLIVGFTFSGRAQQRALDAVDSAKSLVGIDSQVPMDPTARFRVESWQIAWEIIQDYPILGSGYGRYAHEVHERGLRGLGGHSSGGSDSSLMNLWAMSGVLGLMAYLAVLFTAAVVALKRLWGRSDMDAYLMAGLLSGFAGILVHSFFVNSLLFALMMVYLWVGLALMDESV